MTIDDDYFDVADFVKGTEYEDAFDRFSEHTKNTEIENEGLREKCRQLSITIKNMMRIQQTSDDIDEDKLPSIVRIPQFADTMNEFARVDSIDEKEGIVRVSNMNMPYMGTLAGYGIDIKDVEFVKGV